MHYKKGELFCKKKTVTFWFTRKPVFIASFCFFLLGGKNEKP
jgi:hypothetical protein